MDQTGKRTSQQVYDKLATRLEEFRDRTEERDRHSAHGEGCSAEYVEEERVETAVEIAELLTEFDELMRSHKPLPRQWRAGRRSWLRRLRAADAA